MVFKNCGAVITNRFIVCQDTSFAGGKNGKLVFSDNEGNYEQACCQSCAGRLNMHFGGRMRLQT